MASIHKIKSGEILIADDGFFCINNNQLCTVQEENNRLFVKCSHGKHFLDGQVDDPRTGEIIGFELFSSLKDFKDMGS